MQEKDVAYCGKCKTWKARGDFHRDASRPSGVTGHCKVCKKQWRTENAQYLVDKAIEWQRNNPERAKEHGKKWRDSHPDKTRANSKIQSKRAIERRKSDPVLLEKRREQDRRSARQHKPSAAAEKVRRHRRRARKIDNGGTFSQSEWLNLCARYNNLCLCCGEIKPLTADHVIPLSRGGDNTISNIQPLCNQCNSRKRTSSTDYRPLWETQHGHISFQLNLL